ncbi:hypothetical protein SANTM175S_00657 [Streptomyces antimycoticus]
MGSDVPDRFEVPASTPSLPKGRELGVPRYSQEIHKGQYPEYDNGGEAWCSPTSSQMIIEYWGRKPSAADLSWVNPDYADPQVCHAARATFDYQYDGCGNWPFNAAYAATYRDLQGVVTRLGSLTDAEKLIGAGIPVITSQSFLKTELDGAGYGTSGHLMTVIGFTADGDVIANDPASPSNDAVRHIYKRRRVGEHLAPHEAVQRRRQGGLGHRRRLLPLLPGQSQLRPAPGAGRTRHPLIGCSPKGSRAARRRAARDPLTASGRPSSSAVPTRRGCPRTTAPSRPDRPRTRSAPAVGAAGDHHIQAVGAVVGQGRQIRAGLRRRASRGPAGSPRAMIHR